jgi:nucleoside-diphosphate-sugar epimerase
MCKSWKIFISSSSLRRKSNKHEDINNGGSWFYIQVVGIDNFDPFYDRKIKENNLAGLKAKSNFQFLECDICDEKALNELFSNNKIDVVIHLAAKAGVRPSMENPLEYVRVNVQGTTNILEAMRKNGIKKMVFASSSSVYGANEKVPFNEEDSLEKIISIYAATKLSCEKMNKVRGRDQTWRFINSSKAYSPMSRSQYMERVTHHATIPM